MLIYLGYYDKGSYDNYRTYVVGAYSTLEKAEMGIIEYLHKKCENDGYEDYAEWYTDNDIKRMWIEILLLDETKEADE